MHFELSDEQLIPEIEIDAVIQLADIKQSFYNIIEQMGPFGPQNMRPVFATTALTDTGWSRVVKEQHLKFSVRDNTNTRMDGIGFGLAHKYPLLKQGPFDLVYQIEENEWNGSTTLQLMVKDVR